LKVPRRASVSYPNKPKALDIKTTAGQLNEAAERASYTPSPYHCPDGKGRFAGRAKPAMRCEAGWHLQQALNVLRDAIRDGRVSRAWVNGFPRYVWHKAGEVWYEAQTNQGNSGIYHAYPVEDSGIPPGLRK
jgi:hypothetical protein